MKYNTLFAVILAAVLLLSLTACGTTQSPATSENMGSTTQQTEQRSDEETSTTEAAATGEEKTTEMEAAPTGVEEAPETEAASNGEEETAETEATPTGAEEVSEEEPWKTALAEELFEKYGVIPEYYEDLGDGIYQVYVEVGGEVVPFVTVDSATGEYHG